MKKIYTILTIVVLVLSGLGAVGVTSNTTYNSHLIEESLTISVPIIKEKNQYITITLEEAESFLIDSGKPMMPVVTKVYTFPLGTTIGSVEVSFSNPKELIISKEVEPGPELIPLIETVEPEKDEAVYESEELYPFVSYNYKTGAGLKGDKQVLYLAIQCYPIKYSPAQNKIYYSEGAEIKVTYEEPANPMTFNDVYDLVIISPSEFSDELQPLVTHKNNRGVKTILKTTEDIYNEYAGYDEAEEIKYFIKDAIEEWGIEFVLLVGDVYNLPIRTTWFFQRNHGHYWNETVLSDLYYGDIYDQSGEFCSWDTDGDGLYGENYRRIPGINDTVDLYPDVNVGRFACGDGKDVKTVVDKTIRYEMSAFSSEWFNNIILIGGDTFDGWNGYEGEEKNKLTEQIMSDFNPKKFWTSDNTFTAKNINNAINDGAGFIDYSGHGVELGLATHPPNSNEWIRYNYVNLLGALNGYALPIIFFDACLTAKLDFNFSEFINYDPNPNSEEYIELIEENPNPEDLLSALVDCFAWRWVKKNHGGAIATIGATRTAYGSLKYGCGYLSLKYYEAYSESETVSQMLSKAQIAYLNTLWKDYFTVEEFVLLGDPSLKIGGFEENGRSSNSPGNQNLLQNKLLVLILERFPNAFPMLRKLIGLQ